MADNTNPTPPRRNAYAEMMKREKQRKQPLVPMAIKRIGRIVTAIHSHRSALAAINLALLVYLGLGLTHILDRMGILEPLFQRGLADTIGGIVAALVIGIIAIIFKMGDSGREFSKAKNALIMRLAHVWISMVIIIVAVPMQSTLNHVSSFCYNVSGSPANLSKREIRVILAQFEQMSGNALEPNREWADVLEAAIKQTGGKLNVSVQLLPIVIQNREEAVRYSDCFNGTLVIWGKVKANSLESRFQATARWSWAFSPGDLQFTGIPSEQALLMNPGEEPLYALHNVIAQLYFYSSEYEKAIASYTEAIVWGRHKSRYEIAGMHNDRGIAYAKSGQLDLAHVDFTKAIELDPELALAYLNRGNTYKADQIDLAIADYTRAIELAPELAIAYPNRGIAYRKAGQLDLALVDFTKAIELEPQLFPDAYYNRGLIYAGRGKLDLALVDFTKALELDPEFALPYNSLGVVFAERGRLDLAVAHYSRAIELDPELALAYLNRGDAYLEMGQFGLALSDYRVYLKLSGSTDPTILNLLAELEKKAGR